MPSRSTASSGTSNLWSASQQASERKHYVFYILLRFTIVALVLANVKIGTPNPN
jgi:hypothetical protein